MNKLISPSRLFLIAVCALITAVAVMAVQDFHRSRQIEIQALQEKAAVLMRAFESGARTGLGMHWRDQQIQTLVEEMAAQPNVTYLAVTDMNGVILAHSDNKQIGHLLYSPQEIQTLNVDTNEQWHMIKNHFEENEEQEQDTYKEHNNYDKNKHDKEKQPKSEDTKIVIKNKSETRDIFEVYRVYKPFNKFKKPKKNQHPSIKNPDFNTLLKDSTANIDNNEMNKPRIVFVGFDTTALEDTRVKNIRYLIILFIALFLSILAAILVSFWAQRYQRSRLQLEEIMRKNEKLSAIGHLAAGVAHEIRNPLSSIKGFAKYFENQSKEGSESHALAKVMTKEVDRLNRVISELLDLVRPTDIKLEPQNLHAIIEHSLYLIRQDAQARQIEIDYQANENLPEIYLDADRFTQALLNLYLNAIQAIDKNGKLSISVQKLETKHEAKMLEVKIQDSGCGIDAEDLKHIFDPYFTKKAAGTGLGLSIVQKVIEEHRGTIKVVSSTDANNHGTCFSLCIPTDIKG